MATDCSEVSIAQQTDGTFVVIVNDEVLSEALWGRSKVFRDIVEDCEHDAEVHTSISIPTRQMSLWQAEISEGKSIVDVESLCIVLKVAAFLQDEGTVRSATRTIAQRLREELLKASKDSTSPHPLQHRWECIQHITDLLTEHLNEIELAICLQNMVLGDFINDATPTTFLHEFLNDSLRSSGTLDLTVVPHANSWSSCMARVLKAASRAPFRHLKMYARSLVMPPEASYSCSWCSQADLFPSENPHKIRRISNMDDVKAISSRKRHVRELNEDAPDTARQWLSGFMNEKARKEYGIHEHGNNAPLPLRLSELKSLSSIVSLDLTTEAYRLAVPQIHNIVLSMLPALQAVTMPVLAGPSSHPRASALFSNPYIDPVHQERAIDEMVCTDVVDLAHSLASLDSLQSLTLRLTCPNRGCMTLFRRLCQAQMRMTTDLVHSLTRLRFISFDADCSEDASPQSCKLKANEALELVQHIAKFQGLQSLSLQMVPGIRDWPDVVEDIPEYLRHISSLTGLTCLSIYYDVAATARRTLIFQQAPSSRSVFAFLEKLARALEPLKGLKVLHFLCDAGITRPAEYDVHHITQNIEARLQVFRAFARRLDEVVVRGFDGDTTYPFAHLFRDVQSIKQVEICDVPESMPHLGCQFRSPEMARDLQNLQSLTELRLTLSKDLPKDCFEALGVSIATLKHLRKLYIENVCESIISGNIEGTNLQSSQDALSMLPHFVGLPALQDLEQHGCSWSGETAAFAQALITAPPETGIKTSLTRLVLNSRLELYIDGIDQAHIVSQLSNLKHLEFSGIKTFFVGYTTTLRTLSLLENLKLHVGFEEPLGNLMMGGDAVEHLSELPPLKQCTTALKQCTTAHTTGIPGASGKLGSHDLHGITDTNSTSLASGIPEPRVTASTKLWLQGFRDTLCELKHLTSLELTAARPSWDCFDVTATTSNLEPSCSVSESLTNFSETSEGLGRLQSLPSLPQTKSMESDPRLRLEITGSDVVAVLCSAVKKMPQLKHLRVSGVVDTQKDGYLLAKSACSTAVPLSELQQIACNAHKD